MAWQRHFPQAQPRPRRWLILGTVGVAQLMVVLDATIAARAGPLSYRQPAGL
jgi:hypothetical protein